MVSGSRAALAKAVGGSDDQPSASLQCVVDVVTTTAHDKGVVQPRVPMASIPQRVISRLNQVSPLMASS